MPTKQDSSLCKQVLFLKLTQTDQDSLADRTQRNTWDKLEKMPVSIPDWLSGTEQEYEANSISRKDIMFSGFSGKTSPATYDTIDAKPRAQTQRPRTAKDLPFSEHVFQEICERFQLHDSLIRAISKQDTPLFTAENVIMKAPSIGK